MERNNIGNYTTMEWSGKQWWHDELTNCAIVGEKQNDIVRCQQ